MAESEPFQVFFMTVPMGKSQRRSSFYPWIKRCALKCCGPWNCSPKMVMLCANHSRNLWEMVFLSCGRKLVLIYPAYSIFFIGRKIILTNGFIKKTQKTPAADIERAKQYRAEFLRREEAP